MIRINFSPTRGYEKTSLSVSGTILTLNNEEFDLSLLEDGLSATHEKLGLVARNGNDYSLTVKLYHGKNAPHEARFPESVEVSTSYTHEYESGDFS